MKSFLDAARLDSRVILVTGAVGHVGRATCHMLRSLGAHVLVVDRDSAACDQFARDLGDATPLVCDLADLDDVARLAQRVLEQGQLDALVHCAAFVGTSQLPGWAAPITDQTPDAWSAALNVNVSSLFVLAQATRPLLAASGRGSIVAVSSIYGHVGPDMGLYADTAMANPIGYGVTKGGLGQLVRYLATTYAPDVRVNCVSPGGIARGQDPRFVARYEARTPMKRMATEDDMVGAIGFFCSDLSLYVNGQDLLVDGGWTAW